MLSYLASCLLTIGNSSFLTSGRFKVMLYTNARDSMAAKQPIGMGSGNSATKGASPHRPLAINLQMPMAVALFSRGNILVSVNEAKYEVMNPISIPNLAMKIMIGICDLNPASSCKDCAYDRFKEWSFCN